MKACILTNNTRTDNGWGRFARELTLALRNSGIEVLVLCEEVGSFPGERIVLGNSLRFSLHTMWRTLLHVPFLYRNARRVRRLLGGVDIVHALDGYPYGVIAALALRKYEIPLILTLQGTYSIAAFEHAIERRLLLRAIKRASSVVCISSYTASLVQSRIPGTPLGVIGHGTGSFWLDTAKSADPPPIPKPYVLSVGAIKPQKGYRVSIEAFARAQEKFPSLFYAIVGFQGDNHFSQVKQRVLELGIERSVFFFAGLSDEELLRFYDHAELFVLTPISTSRTVEGFGLVYREAASRGLATIGSKNSGAEDATEDEKTGILCPQGDTRAVAAAIEKLCGDAVLRERMGMAGKALAQKHRWDDAARQYAAVYKKVLSRP